jgi:hypothetical protein
MQRAFFLRIFLFILIIQSSVLSTHCQSLTNKKIDSIVRCIESDKSLVIENIVIDTTYFTDKGERFRLQDHLTIYRSTKSKEVKKIVWNRVVDNYYDSLILYYKSGKAIKGMVAGSFRKTDTNPELKGVTSFYIKKGRVFYDKKFDNEFYANAKGYLSFINDYIKITRIKLL